jgi:hypothetical protein
MQENMKVVLFTNARDEKNMHEWVAHHLLLGFDEIYIVDHKSIIPLEGQFDNFNKDVKKVFVKRCEKEGAIKDFLICRAAEQAQVAKADWMLYLDADEFFVINLEHITNVKDLLKNYNFADSVSFNWLLFGSNYHINEPKGFIIDNYTRSILKFTDHLKTFIRPQEFCAPNAHRSDVKNMSRAYHGSGVCLGTIYPPYLDNRHFINNIEYYNSIAYIAHYLFQSEETFIKRKILLPRDDWGVHRTQEETRLGNDFHSKYNDIENFSVKNKYSENIHKYLESIGY